METITRIKINLNNREVEWAGSESFIEKHQAVIDEFISKIKESPNTSYNHRSIEAEVSIQEQQPNLSETIPDSFGAYYTSFSRNIKVVDKILIAAFFVQQKSKDGFFTIKEASELLNEQSVPLTNPNAFLKSLLTTGKVFKSAGKYKVSEKGFEFIKQLKQQSV